MAMFFGYIAMLFINFVGQRLFSVMIGMDKENII